jgi:hypothetical protein
MPELLPKPPFKSHYVVDGNGIVLELYRLLSIFYASKQFAQLNTSLHDDSVAYLLSFQESEITRILTSAAVAARIVDDRDNRYLDEHDIECGELIQDLNDQKKKLPLSLREACNKIIHARKIHYDVEKLSYANYINPVIYYYGSYKGKNWKAILDVEKFAFSYVAYIAQFN